jgi:hypothetical protein
MLISKKAVLGVEIGKDCFFPGHRQARPWKRAAAFQGKKTRGFALGKKRGKPGGVE